MSHYYMMPFRLGERVRITDADDLKAIVVAIRINGDIGDPRLLFEVEYWNHRELHRIEFEEWQLEACP